MMPTDADIPNHSTQGIVASAKVIADLDSLVEAMLSALPLQKPWQRQLAQHLNEASRLIQILRLTVSLQRPKTEIDVSAAEVLRTMRSCNAYVSSSRADEGTRSAVRLAFELARRVDALLLGRR